MQLCGLNLPVTEPTAAEEGQRQVSRLLQGPVVEDARPQVVAGIQTLRCCQVDVREYGFVKPCPEKIGPPEVRPGEVRLGEICPGEYRVG